MTRTMAAILIILLFASIGCSRTEMKEVSFQSEGKKLAGNLYYPPGFEKGREHPAVITLGSWTTVKEQMAGLYAKRLSKQGFLTLAFDFRNFGESEGDIRFFESPEMKIEDIKNAVAWLGTLDEVDRDRIGAFAVCAGAGYLLKAASEDRGIRAVVTAASWLHDAEAVKTFYGGEKGVKKKLADARAAKERYKKTGEVTYVPTISTTDRSAAMYGNYGYYLDPKRGAIPEWSADRFAVMSWEDWLTFDPMPSARKLTTPTLMIHSDGAVLPGYARTYYRSIATPHKKLHWLESGRKPPMEQFEFYDKDEKVGLTVKLAARWFNKYLTGQKENTQ